MSINLGDRAKDRISGFSGIVVAKTHWLNGCVRITIQPEKTDNGKTLDNATFDLEQIELVKPGVLLVQPNRNEPEPVRTRVAGGDRPSVGRTADPPR